MTAAPYEAFFAWLEGRGPLPDVTAAPLFRPLMLAHPLEEAEPSGLEAKDFLRAVQGDETVSTSSIT